MRKELLALRRRRITIHTILRDNGTPCSSTDEFICFHTLAAHPAKSFANGAVPDRATLGDMHPGRIPCPGSRIVRHTVSINRRRVVLLSGILSEKYRSGMRPGNSNPLVHFVQST